MKLSKLSAALCAALAVSMSQGALASQKDHDAAPKHGGIVSVAKDVNYETVAKPDTLTLYVIDHGKPVSAKCCRHLTTVRKRHRHAYFCQLNGQLKAR